MIDKVAKAIHNFMARSAPGPTRHWETAPAEVKQFSRELARAAVQAMREPTDHMCMMSLKNVAPELLIKNPILYQDAVWVERVDAALTEQADA